MPIYEYECTECGEIEEAMQKFSDPPLTTCSHCSGPLKKIISDCAFHLKGSGWYVTDYGGKNVQDRGKKEKDEKEEKAEKETKTEKKKSSEKSSEKSSDKSETKSVKKDAA